MVNLVNPIQTISYPQQHTEALTLNNKLQTSIYNKQAYLNKVAPHSYNEYRFQNRNRYNHELYRANYQGVQPDRVQMGKRHLRLPQGPHLLHPTNFHPIVKPDCIPEKRPPPFHAKQDTNDLYKSVPFR